MIDKRKNISEKLSESIKAIRLKTQLLPKIGVILGSGLGDFADSLEKKVKISNTDIPHIPQSTVPGHHGYLVFGRIDYIPILAVQGRTHYYEGHSISDIAYVVRIMAKLGVKILIVTNAAGGVNPHFAPGDLMIIVDHINFLFKNPLRGPVVEGEARRPDLFNLYDSHLIDVIEKIGMDLKIPLRKGVLFVSTGPTYETAAEIKMIAQLGGDAVSMSTVPEVLVARANSIKIAGISCITNLATGISSTPLSHDEVTEIAQLVKEKFQKLLRAVIIKIGKDFS